MLYIYIYFFLHIFTYFYYYIQTFFSWKVYQIYNLFNYIHWLLIIIETANKATLKRASIIPLIKKIRAKIFDSTISTDFCNKRKFQNKSWNSCRATHIARSKKKISKKARVAKVFPSPGEWSRQLCETRVMKAPSWKPVENKLWKDLGNP